MNDETLNQIMKNERCIINDVYAHELSLYDNSP